MQLFRQPTAISANSQFPSEVYRYDWMIGVFALCLYTALFLAQLPAILDFSTFALYDPGVTLRTDALLARGLTPTIDFGYPYGLLPLMLGRGWFALWGRTPLAYVIFMYVAEIAILWGLWRIAKPYAGAFTFLLLAALPHAIIPVYLHLTHPLEAALIVHALADLLKRNRARALALATLSLFVKPVMGYVFGFFVIAMLAINLFRQRETIKDAWQTVQPALVVGVICALVEMASFGLVATVNALIPANGSQSYRALNFGFFSNGKTFWWPKLATAAQYGKYYLFTPAGYWIICTLFVAILGVASLVRWWQSNESAHAVVFIAAASHFTFIFGFFGWPGTWTYYAAILAVAVLSGLGAHHTKPYLLYGLIFVAFCGHYERVQITRNAWEKMAFNRYPTPLWSFQDVREEWQTVQQRIGQQQVLYLNNGCLELLAPNVEAPASFFLSPASQLPVEITGIRAQLQRAQFVLTFNQAAVLDPWNWPELSNETASFATVWQGKYLTLHARR